MTLALRYAVRSDVGLLREGNEDSAFAGPGALTCGLGAIRRPYTRVEGEVFRFRITPQRLVETAQHDWKHSRKLPLSDEAVLADLEEHGVNDVSRLALVHGEDAYGQHP